MPKLGENFYDHIIQAEITGGAMGKVYKAFDTVRQRTVAIKEVDTSADPDVLEEFFRRELATLRLLERHRGVPKVHTVFRDSGRWYLVMTWIEGATLDHYIQHHDWTEEEVLELTLQLLEPLGFLHEQSPPIVFRDLKPGNVMVDTNGDVWLVDFGIARKAESALQKANPSDTSQFGTEGFTPLYDIGSGSPQPALDIYSLGCLLHLILTKKPRFGLGINSWDPPGDVRNDRTDISDDLADLILRMVVGMPPSARPTTERVRDEIQRLQRRFARQSQNVLQRFASSLARAVQGQAAAPTRMATIVQNTPSPAPPPPPVAVPVPAAAAAVTQPPPAPPTTPAPPPPAPVPAAARSGVPMATPGPGTSLSPAATATATAAPPAPTGPVAAPVNPAAVVVAPLDPDDPAFYLVPSYAWHDPTWMARATVMHTALLTNTTPQLRGQIESEFWQLVLTNELRAVGFVTARCLDLAGSQEPSGFRHFDAAPPTLPPHPHDWWTRLIRWWQDRFAPPALLPAPYYLDPGLISPTADQVRTLLENHLLTSLIDTLGLTQYSIGDLSVCTVYYRVDGIWYAISA